PTHGPENQVRAYDDDYVEREREQVCGETQAEQALGRGDVRSRDRRAVVIEQRGPHVELGEICQGARDEVSESHGSGRIALGLVDAVRHRESLHLRVRSGPAAGAATRPRRGMPRTPPTRSTGRD